MREVLGKGVVLGLLAMGGLSCGDGAESASAFVNSYCELLQPCCAMAGLRSDGQQCRAFLGAFASPSAYDKQAGSACLAELRAAAGKPGFCQMSDAFEPAACDGVFGETGGGSKQPGEACTDDDECARSSEGKVECQTAFAGSTQIRKCQVQIKGKAGDMPCVGTVDGNTTFLNTGSDVAPRGYLCNLADGLRCDTATDACVALKAVGEACTGSSSSECVLTAYCDSVQRKCAERKPAGGMCMQSFSRPQCGEGLYCSTAMTCSAQAADGAACTGDDQCRSDSCVNSKCEAGGGDFGQALLCGAK
jgi:hypothetical protein